MIISQRLARLAAFAAVAVQLASPALVSAGSVWGTPETSLQRLARQIDAVQRHIDEYGTIVPKDPDVWGQSRLLQHRSDFEREVVKKLGAFVPRLNATEFTRDSAFLASALQIQGAIQGRPVPAAPPQSGSTIVQQTYLPEVIDFPNVSGNASALLATQATGNSLVGRTDVRENFGSTFTHADRQALTVGIEQTIELDQMKRYLDHLNEIRRLNEGDDNTDGPGYAIHLVRIPISVLPGKKTHEGYGAEVTVTAKPHLGPELLPKAFRDFVINGVRDRVSAPVLGIADRTNVRDLREKLETYYTLAAPPPEVASIVPAPGVDPHEFLGAAPVFAQVEAPPAPGLEPAPKPAADVSPRLQKYNDAMKRAGSLQGALDNLRELAKPPEILSLPGTRNGHLAIPWTAFREVDGHTLHRVALDVVDLLARPKLDVPRDDMAKGERNLTYPDVEAFVRDETSAAYDFLSQESAQFLWETHCSRELAVSIRELRRGNNPSVDVKPEEKLAVLSIAARRKAFFDDIRSHFPEAKDSSTVNLAWQIIVESALLNEKLIEDMKDLSSSKNAVCLTTEWLPYYGPNPPEEARYAFNQYVECRWPIHVFSVDPVTQDQNVGSGFSMRRELQLVLAIAAASRALTLQSLTQFVRRMEYDLETIDLNRTAVGFSHGSDVFGWRFYPRVQAPDVEGNLTVAVRELLIGGGNRDRRINSRRLEPGIRECTALVVMPSFVPYVTFDTRCNWFRLANHHGCVPPHTLHRRGDLRTAVDLSAEVVKLRSASQECVADAHLYRDGEVYRLQKAVETLDRQLPLQTAYVKTPYENVLGGFDLFDSTASALKPTLRGWYGAPGVAVTDRGAVARNLGDRVAESLRIVGVLQSELTAMVAARAPQADIDKKKAEILAADTASKAALAALQQVQLIPPVNTSLYLVGKNFNMLNTRVIAGGIALSETDQSVRLISRDVLQVVIPSTASIVLEEGRRYVDVHLATPYGPTPRLRIEVAENGSVGVLTALEESVKKSVEDARGFAVTAQGHAAAALASAGTASTQATKAASFVPKFDWEKPQLNGRATLPPGGAAKPVYAFDPVVFLDGTTSPFERSSRTRFGCYMLLKFRNGTLDLVVDPANPGSAKKPFTREVERVPSSGSQPAWRFRVDGLDATVNQELARMSVIDLGPLEAIEIDGYVQVIDTPRDVSLGEYDALPVVKLGKLVVKIPEPVQTAALDSSPFAGERRSNPFESLSSGGRTASPPSLLVPATR